MTYITFTQREGITKIYFILSFEPALRLGLAQKFTLQKNVFNKKKHLSGLAEYIF